VYQSFVDTQHKNGHLPTWCQMQTVHIHCTKQKSFPFSVIELPSRFFGDCIIVGVKGGLKSKTAYNRGEWHVGSAFNEHKGGTNRADENE